MKQRVRRMRVPFHKTTPNSRMRREVKRSQNISTLLSLMNELLNM